MATSEIGRFLADTMKEAKSLETELAVVEDIQPRLHLALLHLNAEKMQVELEESNIS